MKDELQGKNVLNKSMLFECADFGTIYQGDVSTTLQEVFGAEKKRHTKGKRYLKFNRRNLNKLSRIYDVPTEIKVMSIGINGSTNNSTIAKKAKTKSKNKQNKRVTGETGETASDDKQVKGKLEKFIGSSCTTKYASNKNNIKKTPAYAQRSSYLSQSSPSKNYKKIGRKKVMLTK